MKKLVAYLLTLCIFTLNMASAPAATILKSSVQKNDDYKFDYINLKWWDNFNDEHLNSYIEKAVLNNHDLKIASIVVDEYYQNVKLQFANELPSVTGGFSPALLKMPRVDSDWSFAVPAIAQYEADIFLKNHDKTKSMKKLHEASKHDEHAAYIAVASAVGATYINVVKMDKMIDIQEQIVASRKNIMDMTLARYNQGLSSATDTARAKKAYAAGTSELIELKKQRDKLVNQLAVLTGQNPETDLARGKIDNIKFSSNTPKTIPTEVITQRPDYLKAETMVQKAGIDVRVARKEFLPNIPLTGLALFNAPSFNSIFNRNTMLGVLAAGAMLPIFTGGARHANLKLKKHEYERVLQSYYKTNLTAIQEVNDALASVTSDDEKLKLSQEQLNLEKGNYKLSEQRHNEGYISKLNLLIDKESMLVIEKMIAQQKAECFASYIGLYKAAGARI